jgi:alpha-aminoadipic semialdehyde synthase
MCLRERRAPLCPWHVKQLVQEGIKVFVEPSKTRIFVDQEYEAAGAQITSDLSPCSVILGVKQPDISKLLPNKSYMFFAHVIKGQQENRALLNKILELGIRLFDYECIRETGGRTAPRLVAFGKFAGFAGMVNTFQALGQKLLAHGYSTPFLNISSTYMYRDLHAAEQAVAAVGRDIAGGALDRLDFPIVFTFTGNGNVSRGAQAPALASLCRPRKRAS